MGVFFLKVVYSSPNGCFFTEKWCSLAKTWARLGVYRPVVTVQSARHVYRVPFIPGRWFSGSTPWALISGFYRKNTRRYLRGTRHTAYHARWWVGGARVWGTCVGWVVHVVRVRVHHHHTTVLATVNTTVTTTVLATVPTTVPVLDTVPPLYRSWTQYHHCTGSWLQ